MKKARDRSRGQEYGKFIRPMLRAEILFLSEIGPFLGPIEIAEAADPGGPVIEEAVAGGDPIGAEYRRAGQRTEPF